MERMFLKKNIKHYSTTHRCVNRLRDFFESKLIVFCIVVSAISGHNAIAHITRRSMEVLRELFPGHLISL